MKFLSQNAKEPHPASPHQSSTACSLAERCCLHPPRLGHPGECTPPREQWPLWGVYTPSPYTCVDVIMSACGMTGFTQECKPLLCLHACVWSLGRGMSLDSGSSLGTFSNRQWPQSRTAGSYVLTATFNGLDGELDTPMHTLTRSSWRSISNQQS